MESWRKLALYHTTKNLVFFCVQSVLRMERYLLGVQCEDEFMRHLDFYMKFVEVREKIIFQSKHSRDYRLHTS